MEGLYIETTTEALQPSDDVPREVTMCGGGTDSMSRWGLRVGHQTNLYLC